MGKSGNGGSKPITQNPACVGALGAVVVPATDFTGLEGTGSVVPGVLSGIAGMGPSANGAGLGDAAGPSCPAWF